MISCTDFIPAYSEVFTFLDKHWGRGEVEALWDYLFAPSLEMSPLLRHVEKEGILGCWNLWSKNLDEEAADCSMYCNPEEGWYTETMHYCPSKGRLLELQAATGFVPYYDYCMHCEYYRPALTKAGLVRIKDFLGVDHASCGTVIYDPKIFKGQLNMTKATLHREFRAKDLEYLHRSFHDSLNACIEFIGSRHGRDAVRSWAQDYVDHVLMRETATVRKGGLPALRDWIFSSYAREHAEECVAFALEGVSAESGPEGGARVPEEPTVLKVFVSHCPAIDHLREVNIAVSPFYRYTTEDVMDAFAKRCGLIFHMDKYDEGTGKAAYSFTKR